MNEAKMKILVLISEDFYFLSHRRELLLGLKERGFDVSLATHLDEREMEVRATGISLYPVNIYRESLSPFSVVRAAFAYCDIVKKVQPDVVLAVALKPILAATCAMLGSRRPLVCAFAGLGLAFSDRPGGSALKVVRRGMEIFFRILLRRPTYHCLFQNHDDRDLFVTHKWTTAERAVVIPGAGIVLSHFRQKLWSADSPISFLFAGRLLWHKGIKELIDACRILKARRMQFTCRVAGLIDATSRSAVPIDFLEENQRRGLIEWLGPRRDLPDLMASADCFVFPSLYREGVPKVLLEASAAGIPMIATDMPGCRDIVREGFNGWLVPPGDSLALADAMALCIEQRHLLPLFGGNARRQAECDFTVDKVIVRHIDLLNNIVN